MAEMKSEEAAAELYRMAQATALLRLYHEKHGPAHASSKAVTNWARSQPFRVPITPTDADIRAVEREHPDLVALARGPKGGA